MGNHRTFSIRKNYKITMKFVNVKTNSVIESDYYIQGDDWSEVGESDEAEETETKAEKKPRKSTKK